MPYHIICQIALAKSAMTSRKPISLVSSLTLTWNVQAPCTRPLDPASTAHAIWSYKINKARSLNASDAVNTIYSYDLEVISIDNWRVVTTKPANNSDQESH